MLSPINWILWQWTQRNRRIAGKNHILRYFGLKTLLCPFTSNHFLVDINAEQPSLPIRHARSKLRKKKFSPRKCQLLDSVEWKFWKNSVMICRPFYSNFFNAICFRLIHFSRLLVPFKKLTTTQNVWSSPLRSDPRIRVFFALFQFHLTKVPEKWKKWRLRYRNSERTRVTKRLFLHSTVDSWPT